MGACADEGIQCFQPKQLGRRCQHKGPSRYMWSVYARINMYFIREFAAAFFQVCLLFHCQFVQSIVPRHVFRCFTCIVSRDSFQTAGWLWDLCKIARLPDASLTDVQDPLGMKDGNYYSCDWCLLRRDCFRGDPFGQSDYGYKKGDRVRQTRSRRRQSSFGFFLLATYFVTLELDAGFLARLTPTKINASDSQWPTPSRQHKHVPGVWKVLSW